MMKLSEEQLLQTFLLLCYPQTPLQVLEAKLAVGINEAQLKWLVNRHRVWNLVVVNVNKLNAQFFSADFQLWLSTAAERCKQKTFLQFKIQSELSQALHLANINYRFFKGLDLSLRLYGDLNCRFSRDIDLLVSDSDAIAAERILLDYGYTPLNDAFTDTAPGQVIRGSFFKDKSYQASGLPVIELHTRVNNEDTAFSKAVTEALLAGGQPLNVLEYLYLCVHAMKSNCHRVKWLIDLACYYEKLNQQMPNWHEQKWREAKKFGVVRQVIACEYLMAQYLGIAVDPKRFIGLTSYSDWVMSTWLDEYSSLISLKRVVLPMLINGHFEHRLKAIHLLLFCPNDADVAFINRYAFGDGRLLSLLLPFRKLSRYTKKKLLGA